LRSRRRGFRRRHCLRTRRPLRSKRRLIGPKQRRPDAAQRNNQRSAQGQSARKHPKGCRNGASSEATERREGGMDLAGSSGRDDRLRPPDGGARDGRLRFGLDFLEQLADAGSQGGETDEGKLNFILAVVKGIKPRDQLEAMLAAQMAAIHMATSRFARSLGNAEVLPQQDSAERALDKLARTYALQMEALIHSMVRCRIRACTRPTWVPLLRSYQHRLSDSVALPRCTIRLSDKSSGSHSPRFFRHRRMSAASSRPMMIRASDPPMKLRRSAMSAFRFSWLRHVNSLTVAW
jgi:hypothetical protein